MKSQYELAKDIFPQEIFEKLYREYNNAIVLYSIVGGKPFTQATLEDFLIWIKKYMRFTKYFTKELYEFLDAIPSEQAYKDMLKDFGKWMFCNKYSDEENMELAHEAARLKGFRRRKTSKSNKGFAN